MSGIASSKDSPNLASYHAFARFAAATGAVVGVVVLAGWAFDIDAIKSVLPGLVTMKANTAFSFLLAGLALWLLQENVISPLKQTARQNPKWKNQAINLCATLVLTVGVLTLCEYIFKADFGIDQILFRETIVDPAHSHAGRMAPATAFCFFLLGSALLLIHHQCVAVAQWFTVLLGVVVLVALIGYLYDIEDLYRILPYSSMALHTALTFEVLGCGLLCVCPHKGWMPFFTNSGSGGIMARRLFPAAILTPLCVGWLRLQGQQAGLYGTSFGVSLFATANILIFVVIVARVAISLNKGEAERLQTQQALDESEDLFAKAFRLSPDYVAIARVADRSIVMANEAICQLLDVPLNQLIGKPSSDFINPLTEAKRTEFMRELMTRGETLNHETEIILNSGRQIFVSVSSRLVSFHDEPCILSVLRDITAQKELEEDKQRFFSVSQDIFCIFDFDGYFRLLNPAVENVLHFKAEELLGKFAFDYIHPDDLEKSQQALAQVVGGVRLSGFVCRFRRRDNTYRSISWSTAPYGNMFYATGRDISDRIQIESDLQNAVDALTRSNEKLQQFTYVASHDLQEPLRSVGGVVQVLQQRYEDKLDARGQQLITHAIDNVVRMQNLLNDLLIYSRIGTRGAPLELTDSNEIVRHALSNLQAAIEESGAQISVGELPIVKADARQLEQVFQNLLSNAIKFRGAKLPQIQITAHCDADKCLFAVKDNGIGIAPEYFERIFSLFQRLHSRTAYPGTGIGLTICKGVIERHGGQIWVESAPDEGATFYFTIPT